MVHNIAKWFKKQEPTHQETFLDDAKKELEAAEDGLREDLLQTGSTQIQKRKAEYLINRLDRIVKENNIGPSVERSLYGRRT